MNERQTIYDELCGILTDYEHPEDVEGENKHYAQQPEALYNMLLKILNNWEDIITVETEDTTFEMNVANKVQKLLEHAPEEIKERYNQTFKRCTN